MASRYGSTGNPVTLVDLSSSGAQVCLTTRMRPHQRIRLSISDGQSVLRVTASVAWVFFEQTRRKGSPQYLAGLGFLDTDPEIVEAFCAQHRVPQCAEPALPVIDTEKTRTHAAQGVGDRPVLSANPSVQGGQGREAPLDEPSPRVPEHDAPATGTPPATEPRRIKESLKQTRRRGSPAAVHLRDLAPGTLVVVKHRNGEAVVALVRVKRTRFIAKDATDRFIDLSVREFLRPHLE